MKLMLKEYLRSMGERGGLDVLLPNLLSQMGLTVLTTPMRGTKQHGVDVAAVGKIDGDSNQTVYLFSIKGGDINRENWDVGPQALRPSIDEIVDGYIPRSIPPEYAGWPIVIYLCCGGEVRETVRDVVVGYLSRTEHGDPAGLLKCRTMNGDAIAEYVLNHLMSDRLVSIDERRLLFRSLSMVEEPDSSLSYFNRLLVRLLKDEESVKKRIFHVRQLGVCIGLLLHHCIEVKNLDVSYQAAERGLLYAWEYLRLKGLSPEHKMEEEVIAFNQLWWQYVEIGQLYCEKVSAFCEDAYFMTYACNAGCEVDVNLRLYDVIGRLASFGAALWWYALALRQCNDLMEPCKEVVGKVANALVGILKNNPTVRSLIRDDYAIEIGLVSVFLNQIMWGEELHRWYQCLMNQTYKNFVVGRAFPSVGLDYLGLIDHLSQSHDEQYQKKVLPSSELFPMIYMLASALKFDDVCSDVVDIVKNFLKECDFQVWFPEPLSEEAFYTNNNNHGMQLVSQNLIEGGKFMETVFRECDKRPLPYVCAHGAFGGLILLGCRVHRCPLPPHFVQLIAKSAAMRNAAAKSAEHGRDAK